MKIRTDFVTNSSSTSTAEVVIDNSVLLEILQKYKDLNTFKPNYSDFSLGKFKKKEGSVLPSIKKISNSSVFHVGLLEDSSWNNVPFKLSDVVESILFCLENEYAIKDKNLFEQMKAELIENKHEIDAAYKYIAWQKDYGSNENDEDYYGEINENSLFVFNPMTGEDYHFTKIAGIGDDEEIEEGFVFAEKHIVNGEVKIDFEYEPKESPDDEDDEEDED